MHHPLFRIVEARIREAEEQGAFDDLPGAGRPIPTEPESEDALLHRLLKDNGAVPEVVSLSRELARLRAAYRAAGGDAPRREIVKEMSMVEARIEIARRRRR